jgi:hypothetical protein
MNKRLVAFLESLVVAAILLALVQTFLEDFSVLARWSQPLRRRVLLTGFFFDLFFTIEFLVRLFYAITDRRVGRYLGRERGWIDFLASVPLLMFNSGPVALAAVTGQALVFGMGGTLNLLKVIKAIRIARILRLLRIIKIFRRIKNVSSPMAQRHVAAITAISVTVVVFSLLFFTLVAGNLRIDGPDTALAEREQRVASHLEILAANRPSFVQALSTLAETDASLLVVRYEGAAVYCLFDDPYYGRAFGPGDYSYLQRGSLELFFDHRPQARQLARESVLFFAIVVLVVLAYLLIYSPHFALTVTDPIHVMRRGMDEPQYNLEVKVPPAFADDDVFVLARLYNEKFLPLKDRSGLGQGQPMLDLDVADVSGFAPGKDS